MEHIIIVFSRMMMFIVLYLFYIIIHKINHIEYHSCMHVCADNNNMPPDMYHACQYTS